MAEIKKQYIYVGEEKEENLLTADDVFLPPAALKKGNIVKWEGRSNKVKEWSFFDEDSRECSVKIIVDEIYMLDGKMKFLI